MLSHVHALTLIPENSAGSVDGRSSVVVYIPRQEIPSSLIALISHSCPSAFFEFLLGSRPIDFMPLA